MKTCEPRVQPGRLAPDFRLPDSEGQEWHLQALRGRPVVLVFTRHLS
jgi:peroxiredoxin